MRSMPSRRRLASHAARHVVRLRAALSSSLDRMPNLVATIASSRRFAERPAEEPLAVGAAVDVGGVEEVDAGVERGVARRRRVGFVDASCRSCCSRDRRQKPTAIRCGGFSCEHSVVAGFSRPIYRAKSAI